MDDLIVTTNLQGIIDSLTKAHGWRLSAQDQDGIARVYRAFCRYRPGMNSTSDLTLSSDGVGRSGPTYHDLMIQKDDHGRALSYLGSEEQFGIIRDLQRRNLVIPIVGDFAGPKALRGVAQYLKDHRASVGVFYLSNVEGYLRKAQLWDAFCANVAAMPTVASSLFVRVRTTSLTPYLRGMTPPLVPSAADVVPIEAEVQGCRGR